MLPKTIITLLTFIFGIFMSMPLSGQVTDRGNFLIGGTMGFSSSNSTVEVSGENIDLETADSRATQFNIAPSIGYFFARNFSLGIGLDYTLNKVEEPRNLGDGLDETRTEFDSDLLFGPFARYYLPVGIDKAFFLEATFGYGSSVDEIELQNTDQTTSTQVYAFGLGPGFTIFSRDAIGIEALVKYNWAQSDTDIALQGINTEAQTTTNQIDFSIGLQFYFTRLQPSTTRQEGTEERTRPRKKPDFY